MGFLGRFFGFGEEGENLQEERGSRDEDFDEEEERQRNRRGSGVVGSWRTRCRYCHEPIAVIMIDEGGNAEGTCPECGSYKLGGRSNYDERVINTHRTRCRYCGEDDAVLIVWSNKRKEVICTECGREWA